MPTQRTVMSRHSIVSDCGKSAGPSHSARIARLSQDHNILVLRNMPSLPESAGTVPR
jgi:hypothetical protein